MTQSYFDSQARELSFKSSDIKTFGTQTITFTITGISEGSRIKNKPTSKKDEDVEVNIDYCVIVGD